MTNDQAPMTNGRDVRAFGHCSLDIGHSGLSQASHSDFAGCDGYVGFPFQLRMTMERFSLPRRLRVSNETARYKHEIGQLVPQFT